MITLIGLGPAHLGGMSVAARDAMRAATRLFVRTARHPAVDGMVAEGIPFEALDVLYETLDSFDEVYDAVADRVLDAANAGDVALAVPGHPLVAEEAVRRLLQRARDAGVSVQVAGSSSFIEPTLSALEVSLDDGLLLVDALALDHVKVRADLGALVYQVYDRDIASSAKLALMRVFPDDWPVRVVRQAGVPGAETVTESPLHRLDRMPVDHLTAVYVPPMPDGKRKRTFDDLVMVMERLRAPDGCPWDREQDHKTLRKWMFEECCEAVDAIDADDLDGLCEELGDILLQVVFHAQIEAEEGAWTIDDVTEQIVEKLVRRHPHVFADGRADDPDAVVRTWERIKATEKSHRESILDGVPASLPALMRAMEISERAVKVGFEWERFEDVLAKMEEEIREMREAIADGRAGDVADEIGDLLFSIVNVARWQKVDPEESLRRMLGRFSARFRHIELSAKAQGRALTDLTLAEMDALWDEAKAGARSLAPAMQEPTLPRSDSPS